MITEVLTWLQLQSANVEMAKSASNLLVLAYILLYLKIKEANLTIAFLFSELLFSSTLLNNFNNANYYLLQSFFDCIVVSVIINKKTNTIKVLYLIMIVTNLAMCNEEIQGYGKTVLYNNYSNIILFIHVLIIISASNIIRFNRSKSTIVNFISNFVYNKHNSINLKMYFHKPDRSKK